MERRLFIKNVVIGTGSLVYGRALAHDEASILANNEKLRAQLPAMDPAMAEHMRDKMANFDNNFDDDIYVPENQKALFLSTARKLEAVQQQIGYARFTILSFDDLLKTAMYAPGNIAFRPPESQLIVDLFQRSAHDYGFYGGRVIDQLTAKVKDRDIIKVSGSAHYVFKGKPLSLYRKVIKDVGGDIVLTSGIRSVIKQTALFMNKTLKSDGNMSRAARSLAPPGYSYHGISDFDVGKVGFGAKNFTESFARTEIFKRLIDLGYVDLRYTKLNPFGVRFEPWHIKVT